jgi:hypothetical protein
MRSSRLEPQRSPRESGRRLRSSRTNIAASPYSKRTTLASGSMLRRSKRWSHGAKRSIGMTNDSLHDLPKQLARALQLSASGQMFLRARKKGSLPRAGPLARRTYGACQRHPCRPALARPVQPSVRAVGNSKTASTTGAFAHLACPKREWSRSRETSAKLKTREPQQRTAPLRPPGKRQRRTLLHCRLPSKCRMLAPSLMPRSF